MHLQQVSTVGERYRDQGNERATKRTCWSVATEWGKKKGSGGGAKIERTGCCNHTG